MKKNIVFRRCQEVVEDGDGACERVGRKVAWNPTEQLRLRRQMATAGGKNAPVSLSLSLETNDVPLEPELSFHNDAVLGGGSVNEPLEE